MKGMICVMMNFYKSESDEYPDDVDTESSPTTVYVRRNIEEVEREDPDGETRTVYEYEEAALTRDDYAIYTAEVAQATTDYIAMMLEVDV